MLDLKSLMNPKFRSISTKRLDERTPAKDLKHSNREVRIKLSGDDLTIPKVRENRTKKTVSVVINEPSEERKNGNPADELSAAKDRFKQLILQQSAKSPMRDIENMLKEQALLKKALEQQGTASTRRLKLNIEDRFSDEGDSNASLHYDNHSVRMLDRWQLENKKKTLLAKVEHKAESIAKTVTKNTQDTGMNPTINQEIVNLIINSEEDQDRALAYQLEQDQKEEDPKKNTEHSDEEKSKLDESDNKGVRNSRLRSNIRGLENQRRELNRKILQNLLFKKLSEKHQRLLNGEGSSKELSNQINTLMQESAKNFMALRGISIINDMENMANKFVKKKIEHEKLAAYASASTKLKNSHENSEKHVLDLRFAEKAITQKYQECIAEILNIRDKVAAINHENYMLRVEIKNNIQEKEEGVKKFDEMEAMVSSENKEKAQGLGRRKAVEKGNLEEYMKLQKIRAEKKKYEQTILDRIEEIENKIKKNNQTILQHENETKNMKQLKTHYKLQLKELYQQALSNENDIRNPGNLINYCAIIVSMWKIHEELGEQNLPRFLDKESAAYMIQYAKQSYELEKFCKENGMTDLLNALDNTKDGGTPSMRLPNINMLTFDRSQLYASNKELKELIHDVKERMSLIKKREIKAKRFISLPSPHRMREKLIKEETVDLVSTSEIETRLPHKELSLGQSMINRQKEKSPANRTLPKSVSEQYEEMIRKLENLKKQEVARLFKINMVKNTDERLQEHLQKVLRFVFGKKESDEIFSRFVKEKRLYDRKMQKTLGISGSEGQQQQNERNNIMVNLRAKSNLRHSHEALSNSQMTPSNNISQLSPLENYYPGLDIKKIGRKSHSESKRNFISDTVL